MEDQGESTKGWLKFPRISRDDELAREKCRAGLLHLDIDQPGKTETRKIGGQTGTVEHRHDHKTNVELGELEVAVIHCSLLVK